MQGIISAILKEKKKKICRSPLSKWLAMVVKKNSLLPGGGLQQLSGNGKEKTRQRSKHKLREIKGKFAVVIIST